MGSDDGAHPRAAGWRAGRGRALGLAGATALYLGLCALLGPLLRPDPAVANVGRLTPPPEASNRRNGTTLESRAQTKSPPTPSTEEMEGVEPRWVPTGDRRFGPFTFRCLGNNKYLSISSRGHIRPAAHDPRHRRAHWYLVPVQDGGGNLAMALQPVLGRGKQVYIETIYEELTHTEGARTHTEGARAEQQVAKGELETLLPHPEKKERRYKTSMRLTLSHGEPAGWRVHWLINGVSGARGVRAWLTSSALTRRGLGARVQLRLQLPQPAEPPVSASNDLERFQLERVCLHYAQTQPLPAITVELSASVNCSGDAATHASLNDAEFAWEIGEAEIAADGPRNGSSSTTVISLGVAVRTQEPTAPSELPLVKVLVNSLIRSIAADLRSPFDAVEPELRTDRDGFHYQLMLGYDAEDPTYDDPVLLAALGKLLRKKMKGLPISVLAMRYTAENRGAPCWIWNKLFAHACTHGTQYFYQLNDDLELVSEGWARRFIQSLKQSDPPDVGITGPLDLNNERLMTQSFASCKHYEIFGFYYPWHFKNWYSDDWAAQVYAERTYWHTDIEVDHSWTRGPRYRVNYEHSNALQPLLRSARQTVCKWAANQSRIELNRPGSTALGNLHKLFSFCTRQGAPTTKAPVRTENESSVEFRTPKPKGDTGVRVQRTLPPLETSLDKQERYSRSDHWPLGGDRKRALSNLANLSKPNSGRRRRSANVSTPASAILVRGRSRAE